MQTSIKILALAAFAVGSTGAWAQTTPPPPPPPPGAYSGVPYTGAPLNPDTNLVASISVPYAFNWNAVGISAELGGLFAQHHFIGGEISYYGSENERYDVYSNGAYIGRFYASQQVTTVDAAYRFYTPVWTYGPRTAVDFYAGASGGIGWVNYSNNGGYFGFHNDESPEPTGELLAGFQLHAGPGVSFRLGYRYVALSNVWHFDQRVDLDTSAIEAGATFRF